MTDTYGKPPLLLRPLISLFGEYHREVWFGDEDSEEGGLYFTLFGFTVLYGLYFERW